jgi:hypothetical protein
MKLEPHDWGKALDWEKIILIKKCKWPCHGFRVQVF